MKTEHTAPSLEATLSQLRVLAPQLSALDDEMSQRIDRIEQAIVSLGLGVRVPVPLVADDPQGDILAFAKFGDRWRLVVERQDRPPHLLANCGRDVRAALAERLPVLLNAGVESLRTRIVQRRAALQTVDQALQAFVGHVTAAEQP